MANVPYSRASEVREWEGSPEMGGATEGRDMARRFDTGTPHKYMQKHGRERNGISDRSILRRSTG